MAWCVSRSRAKSPFPSSSWNGPGRLRRHVSAAPSAVRRASRGPSIRSAGRARLNVDITAPPERGNEEGSALGPDGTAGFSKLASRIGKLPSSRTAESWIPVRTAPQRHTSHCCERVTGRDRFSQRGRGGGKSKLASSHPHPACMPQRGQTAQTIRFPPIPS